MMDKNVNETGLLLSIIIPVFNAEKYLGHCLDSLLEQDVDIEYELICVNDGSTDTSLNILQKYAKKNKCIRVIDKTNGGVAAARNLGLKAARGEYVWFVDADDWIARNCLGLIASKIKEYHPSVVQLNYDYIKAEWRVKECEKIALKANSIDCHLRDITVFPDSPVWPYLIKKEVLAHSKLKFIEGLHFGEDILFTRELFDFLHLETEKGTKTHKILYCSGDIFYYYRQHDSSAMSQSFTNNRAKYMDALLKMAYIYHEHMQEKDKPEWYIRQYEELFYIRMYTYMIHWLPDGCSNLKDHLRQLKKAKLYPCAKPPEKVYKELTKADSLVPKIKKLCYYIAFRSSWLYPVFYKLMTYKYQKNEP